MTTLKNKVALVTGSTSGIGFGIARSLAQAGTDLMIHGFGDAAEVDAQCRDLAALSGGRVAYSAADVTNPAAVREMVAQCTDELGAVDILVNNAGIQYTCPIDTFPDDRWDAILATNLSANFHAIKAVLPQMRARDWGRIVNIASAHALVASVTKSAYVAAKHGVIGLTKVVALETARSGITCNAICPGMILTPLVQKQIDDWAERDHISNDEARSRMIAEKIPTGQFQTAAQIGALVVFLCSEEADQIRGAAMPVDGGWTVW
ncbi:3-hydroxybutyrate dehydrogenase [Paraburkholderia caballeronis]|uniref:3-hydroxybutyrate dehydrogenase n=1 Tax=Paraburkholderia caballeronis TaxID=416943 RepID=UPI001065CC58|nr:3-hydroxybutyrate dehydrogenase [Paraburkholderia caballeronis]TDV35613.1 3-hydroxybutyrate dehydrogenase [Paraburkholderia caballeronis]